LAWIAAIILPIVNDRNGCSYYSKAIAKVGVMIQMKSRRYKKIMKASFLLPIQNEIFIKNQSESFGFNAQIYWGKK
jgi:hypothetical protein